MHDLTVGFDKVECNFNHRLENKEYAKYLEYYNLEDSEHNYKCFVIWKGFGMCLNKNKTK